MLSRRSFRTAPEWFCLSRGTCGLQFLASFQCFCILSPRICELEHQSTLLGIVRLCSSAEAFLRLIFIDLSQSAPLNYLVPRCRVQVRHPSDKRAKKFLVCTGSWAAAELTSPRQARAALGAAAGLTLERNTIIGPLGTGRPRGDLFGCVRPKGPLLWCNDGRGRPRCLADPGACSLVR